MLNTRQEQECSDFMVLIRISPGQHEEVCGTHERVVAEGKASVQPSHFRMRFLGLQRNGVYRLQQAASLVFKKITSPLKWKPIPLIGSEYLKGL
jgi:hypothetical protein